MKIKLIMIALLLCSNICYSQDDVYGQNKKLNLATEKLLDSNYKNGSISARQSYRNYKGASTGTFIVSFLTGPITGLIPAIATTSGRPMIPMYPMNEKFKVQKFYEGYEETAKSIRSRKVWKNYAIGSFLGVSVGVSAYFIIRNQGSSLRKHPTPSSPIPRF